MDIKKELNLQDKNDHEADKKKVSKRKVRFKEILDERSSNEQWLEMKTATKEEEDGVLYNEIIETENNFYSLTPLTGIYLYSHPQSERPGIVWKLLKPCYGLDYASRKWLLDLDFRQSKREICLFYYMMEEKLEGFLMFYG